MKERIVLTLMMTDYSLQKTLCHGMFPSHHVLPPPPPPTPLQTPLFFSSLLSCIVHVQHMNKIASFTTYRVVCPVEAVDFNNNKMWHIMILGSLHPEIIEV